MSVALDDQGDTVPNARHREQAGAASRGFRARIGIEQAPEDRFLRGLELARGIDEVDKLRLDRPHARHDAPQRREQPLDAEARECAARP